MSPTRRPQKHALAWQNLKEFTRWHIMSYYKIYIGNKGNSCLVILKKIS